MEAAIAHAIPSADHHCVGPNAVTQIQSAMIELGFCDRLEALFTSATAYDWLYSPPTAMVEEARVARLHRSVRTNFSVTDAEAVLKRAGELTGAYILANRIPKFAQAILKLLPKPLAAHLLSQAIKAHAWTFAGSGRVSIKSGKVMKLVIDDNPLCRRQIAPAPLCIWHEAVVTTLYRALVSSDAKVREVECGASGDPHCIFEITL